MKLQKKAEENTTVKRGSEVVKEGIPNDHTRKHLTSSSTESIVGANVGMTLNMQDYNSLRVDCWLTDSVKENETQEEAYSRILGVIDKTLRDTIAFYRE